LPEKKRKKEEATIEAAVLRPQAQQDVPSRKYSGSSQGIKLQKGYTDQVNNHPREGDAQTRKEKRRRKVLVAFEAFFLPTRFWPCLIQRAGLMHPALLYV
jgi:hypothetical protein